MLCSVAPAAGPQVYARPQANGILVLWEEIPPQQQMGCITWYKIYLQRKASDVDPNVGGYLVINNVMCKCCLLRGGGGEGGFKRSPRQLRQQQDAHSVLCYGCSWTRLRIYTHI